MNNNRIIRFEFIVFYLPRIIMFYIDDCVFFTQFGSKFKEKRVELKLGIFF